jgi:hypothetical protein
MDFQLNSTKTNWDVLKGDLMMMFRAFEEGNLPLFHLKFGTIILLLKIKCNLNLAVHCTKQYVYQM